MFQLARLYMVAMPTADFFLTEEQRGQSGYSGAAVCAHTEKCLVKFYYDQTSPGARMLRSDSRLLNGLRMENEL